MLMAWRAAGLQMASNDVEVLALPRKHVLEEDNVPDTSVTTLSDQ